MPHRAHSERLTLLDDLIPTYDMASRHTIRIAASPAHVYEAARHADLGRLWPVRVLMGLRAIPAFTAVALRRRPRATEEPGGVERSVGAATFTLIAEVPGEEFVLGIMGRFWTPTGGVIRASADRFRHRPPPGLAQGLWNFRVEPGVSGTELSTETRVRCPDAQTRRHFLRYWRVIRPGSALIRGSMLRYIRTLAERRAD